VAAVIVATIPLISPLFAWYFFREKLKWMNVAGLSLSFAGVALVVLNGSLQFDASPLGVGLEFIAVLSAIGYSVVLRKLVDRYNTLSIIAYQNIIGIFYFLPVWLVVDYNDFLQRPFHSEAFRAIVLLAVFSSLLAFVFFTQSIRQIGVNRSNSFINLIPVFVAVLSFFVLNENLNLQKFIGIVVVVAGLFLAQVKRKPARVELAEVEHTP
jgi:drug/metabolite transporter (DMT)-like permease